MKFQKGFSLVELMVVVAIVGILASVSYAYYGRSIRQSRQLEAKTHLGQVRQLQISHFTEFRSLNTSMQNLGFKPLGQIRYNIGTRWYPNINDSLVPSICPCLDTTKECFAHPKPEFTIDFDSSDYDRDDYCGSSIDKCFGSDTGDIRAQIQDSVWQRTSHQSSPLDDLFWKEGRLLDGSGKLFSRRPARNFVYIAVGCTSSTKTYMKESNLDIWAITRRGILKNIQNGVTRDATD